MSEATQFQRGERFGRFALTYYLGRGGFGEVWRGEDTIGDGSAPEEVAIKIFRPPDEVADMTSLRAEMLRHLVQGAGIIREVKHSRIARPITIGQRDTDHALYIVTAYLSGGDLMEYIADRGGRLSETSTLALLEPVVAAVAACHRHPRCILHRDLKPANILLDGRVPPRAFVTDFDTVIALDDRSRAASAIGSAGYAAPEVWAGQGSTAASDVYSLGVTLYWAMTGQMPDDDRDAQLTAARVSLPVARAIGKALRLQPERRFADAGELLEALRGEPVDLEEEAPVAVVATAPRRVELTLADGTPGAAPVAVPPPEEPPEVSLPATERARPTAGAWIVALVLLVAGLTALVAFVGSYSQPGATTEPDTATPTSSRPPLFSNPVGTATRGTCSTRLKQLCIATLQYAQDHDEKLPPATPGSLDASVHLGAFIRDPSILICPRLDRAPSYAYAGNNPRGVVLAAIRQPNLQFMFVESTAPPRIERRHGGGANFGYFDGHVASHAEVPNLYGWQWE